MPKSISKSFWLCVSFITVLNGRLALLNFHSALNPESPTDLVSGNTLPEKEGLGHDDLIVKLLLPERGRKLMFSLPLTVIRVPKEIFFFSISLFTSTSAERPFLPINSVG